VAHPDGTPGERDLAVLLASLDPELHPGRYAFTLAIGDGLPSDLDVVAMVREAEGVTLVVAAVDADRAGLRYDGTLEWITLRVHSALDAVGLTAAFSTALAAAGIGANVVAGPHHDHVFVPAGQGSQALHVLRTLSAASARR
jgi:hypothetical protein